MAKLNVLDQFIEDLSQDHTERTRQITSAFDRIQADTKAQGQQEILSIFLHPATVQANDIPPEIANDAEAIEEFATGVQSKAARQRVADIAGELSTAQRVVEQSIRANDRQFAAKVARLKNLSASGLTALMDVAPRDPARRQEMRKLPDGSWVAARKQLSQAEEFEVRAKEVADYVDLPEEIVIEQLLQEREAQEVRTTRKTNRVLDLATKFSSPQGRIIAENMDQSDPAVQRAIELSRKVNEQHDTLAKLRTAEERSDELFRFLLADETIQEGIEDGTLTPQVVQEKAKAISRNRDLLRSAVATQALDGVFDAEELGVTGESARALDLAFREVSGGAFGMDDYVAALTRAQQSGTPDPVFSSGVIGTLKDILADLGGSVGESLTSGRLLGEDPISSITGEPSLPLVEQLQAGARSLAERVRNLQSTQRLRERAQEPDIGDFLANLVRGR